LSNQVDIGRIGCTVVQPIEHSAHPIRFAVDSLMGESDSWYDPVEWMGESDSSSAYLGGYGCVARLEGEQMSEPDPYFLGYRPAEQARLERQAHELAHDSAWLFDQVGVRQGWRVIEIGCGPQGCLGLLAERVGATGRVVGIERSTEQVARAQQFVADNHFTNVDVLHADARRTDLPAHAFDFATARLVK